MAKKNHGAREKIESGQRLNEKGGQKETKEPLFDFAESAPVPGHKFYELTDKPEKWRGSSETLYFEWLATFARYLEDEKNFEIRFVYHRQGTTESELDPTKNLEAIKIFKKKPDGGKEIIAEVNDPKILFFINDMTMLGIYPFLSNNAAEYFLFKDRERADKKKGS